MLRLEKGRELGPVAVFLGILASIILAFSLASDEFFTVANLTSDLKHLAVTALAALGLTFVVVVGHSDMSFHFVSCFAGMTMSYFIGQGAGPGVSILAGLVAGALFGTVSGVAVGKIKLPDVIVTIALGSVAWGLAYLYSNGSYIYKNFLSSGIIAFSDGTLLGVPYPVIDLFVLYAAGYVLLHRTRFGRGFYATGGNKVAASFSGIRVDRYVVAAFALSSLMASFSNVLMTAAQGNGNVKGGLALLMPAWAAVFVGSSIFKKPTVAGTFFGAFMMSILQDGFMLLNAPFYIRDLIVGVTLIGAMVVSRVRINHQLSRPAAQRRAHDEKSIVPA